MSTSSSSSSSWSLSLSSSSSSSSSFSSKDSVLVLPIGVKSEPWKWIYLFFNALAWPKESVKLLSMLKNTCWAILCIVAVCSISSLASSASASTGLSTLRYQHGTMSFWNVATWTKEGLLLWGWERGRVGKSCSKTSSLWCKTTSQIQLNFWFLLWKCC